MARRVGRAETTGLRPTRVRTVGARRTEKKPPTSAAAPARSRLVFRLEAQLPRGEKGVRTLDGATGRELRLRPRRIDTQCDPPAPPRPQPRPPNAMRRTAFLIALPLIGLAGFALSFVAPSGPHAKGETKVAPNEARLAKSHTAAQNEPAEADAPRTP